MNIRQLSSQFSKRIDIHSLLPFPEVTTMNLIMGAKQGGWAENRSTIQNCGLSVREEKHPQAFGSAAKMPLGYETTKYAAE